MTINRIKGFLSRLIPSYRPVREDNKKLKTWIDAASIPSCDIFRPVTIDKILSDVRSNIKYASEGEDHSKRYTGFNLIVKAVDPYKRRKPKYDRNILKSVVENLANIK